MNPGLFKDSTSLTVAPEVFYGLMTRGRFVSGVTDFVGARTAKSNPNIYHTVGTLSIRLLCTIRENHRHLCSDKACN